MPEPRSRPLDPELLFRALARHGVRFVLVGAMGARLEDILRSKVAADRPQDRQDAIVIRAMLQRRLQRRAPS